VQRSLLCHALHHKRDGMALALLEAGADGMEPDVSGVLPLHLAASHGLTTVVEWLLAAGVPADVRGPGGVTACMAGSYFPAVVNLLLRAGANPNARDDSGTTVFRHCWLSRWPRDAHAAAAVLVAGADPEPLTVTQRELLLLATVAVPSLPRVALQRGWWGGDVYLSPHLFLERLVAHNVVDDAKLYLAACPPAVLTPRVMAYLVSAAVSACSVELVDALLHAGGTVDAYGPSGRTPLLQAAAALAATRSPRPSHVRMVAALLDRGADPLRVCLQSGHTVLHLLADGDTSECWDAVAIAVECGAVTSPRTEAGVTPFGHMLQRVTRSTAPHRRGAGLHPVGVRWNRQLDRLAGFCDAVALGLWRRRRHAIVGWHVHAHGDWVSAGSTQPSSASARCHCAPLSSRTQGAAGAHDDEAAILHTPVTLWGECGDEW
jgi:hypothetical protein